MSSGATVRRSITSTEMPVGGQLLGGRDRLVHHAGHRHDRHVGAGAHDGRPADRDDVVGGRLRALHAVEQPVLDEHDGVRVLDRRPEQAVGVGRRRRHDDGQPGDVGEQRLEALRVLAARGATGAELRAHGERHLGGAAGHERQLGRLVEQLVEADAEEVEVHHLDHRAHPGHRRADAEADDRRLGDRACRARARGTGRRSPRVSPKTLPPAPTSMPATNTRSSEASSISRADADGVHRAEHRCVRRRSRRLGGARDAAARRSRSSVLRAGLASPRACVDRGVELGGHRRLEGLDLVVGDTGVAQPPRVADERVVRPPLVELLRRAVALGIALVVAVPAVGRRLDDAGPAAGRGRRRPRPPSPRRRRRRRCRRPQRSGMP